MTIFHCNIRNRQYTQLVASERHLYTLNKTLDARIDECCIDTPLWYSYDSSKFQERAQCISTGGTLSETHYTLHTGELTESRTIQSYTISTDSAIRVNKHIYNLHRFAHFGKPSKREYMENMEMTFMWPLSYTKNEIKRTDGQPSVNRTVELTGAHNGYG